MNEIRSVTRLFLFNFRSGSQKGIKLLRGAALMPQHFPPIPENIITVCIRSVFQEFISVILAPLSNPARCILQDYVAKRVPLQLHAVIRHARISRITVASPGRPLSGEYYSCGEISRHATCMFNVRRSFDFKGSHSSISCRNYGVCSRDESSWSPTLGARWISVL